MSRITEYYKDRADSLSAELQQLKSQFTYMYIGRLLSFAGFCVLLAFYFGYRQPLFLVFSLLVLCLFCFLVKLDLKYVARKRYLESKLAINNGEIKVLDGMFSDRKSGEEYSDIDPFLTADFDIVGQGSLFQFLNRTSTKLGEELFIQNLCSNKFSCAQIESRQQAIRELAEDMDFIQDFQIYGGYFQEKDTDIEYLRSWIKDAGSKIGSIRTLRLIAPLLFLVWLVLFCFDLLPLSSISIPIIFNLMIVNLNMKHIIKSHSQLDKTLKIIKKYTKLIAMIEDHNFESSYLNDKKSNLSGNGLTASVSINKLVKLLNLFDFNYNIVVSLLLNSVFGFSLHLYYSLHKWRVANGRYIEDWFYVISEFDSLVSYSVFAHNNAADVIYPEAQDQKLCIEAQELGHPLIPSSRRVSNDILIQKSPSMIIITGANMAGKSTFLRTVAVNMMLAMNGSAVMAQQFRFSPCNIISSIKIQDALSKNESYFYAEISRLKDIVTRVRQGERTLVILDEILRGTNTKDKQQGSLGLLQKLISDNAIVFVATHDLVIGNLEKDYPQIAKNYCFEVELADNRLEFDYKLKDGVSQKLNASFLLKQMGLID